MHFFSFFFLNWKRCWSNFLALKVSFQQWVIFLTIYRIILNIFKIKVDVPNKQTKNPWDFNPAIQPFSYRVEYLLITSLKYDVIKFDFFKSEPQKPHARICSVLNAYVNLKSANSLFCGTKEVPGTTLGFCDWYIYIWIYMHKLQYVL